MHLEFKFLTDFFFKNGFPISLINSQIKKFLHKQFTQQSNTNNNKEQIYISFPYFGQQSETMRTELKISLDKILPNFNFNISLVNKFTIGSFFNYKDKLPFAIRSSCVYKFSCAQCARSYVGSSTRSFHTRIAEHGGRSSRTGRNLSAPPFSAIREHCNSCNSIISPNNFKIIDYSKDVTSLRLIESLYIFKLKPDLNSMQTAFPLLIVK